LTTQEKAIRYLENGGWQQNIRVSNNAFGRALYAVSSFKRGDFVCEYEGIIRSEEKYKVHAKLFYIM